jgi:hypothetical protein
MSTVPPGHDQDASPISGEWECILREFRALGGVVENVALGHGPFGCALFPRNPAEPFLIRVPDNLLFRVNDIEFEGDRIGLGADALVSSPERDFFQHYQNAFSWGGEEYRESANLIAMFDSLSQELRTTLSSDFRMHHFVEGDPATRIRRHFLRGRMIRWNNENIHAPVLELAKRGSDGFSCASAERGGLQINGQTEGEILLHCGQLDTFDVFRNTGLTVGRPFAHSLPVTVKIRALDLTIFRKTGLNAERAGISTPQLSVNCKTLSLSYLMIGNSGFPRLSRGIFCSLMRQAGAAGPEEAFDTILHINRTKFLGLLEALEAGPGELVRRLRSMAHCQLEAMAHCVGTCEL